MMLVCNAKITRLCNCHNLSGSHNYTMYDYMQLFDDCLLS